jgi:hypothetical protein
MTVAPGGANRKKRSWSADHAIACLTIQDLRE